ncbi:MAG: hypothetical protein A2Y33_16630 [Spirochaetes bacterium GWF1_51_8]|nr:MAG: hypothetical protein A2Y33_16630 [Spirochaetes bacterium GWF1_51_8]
MKIEKLSGKKCYLTHLSGEYIPLFIRWMSDPEVTMGLNSTHQNIDRRAELDFMEFIKQNNWHYFVIVERETDNPIGAVMLFDVNQTNRTAEMGINIGEKSRWGKGFASEAIGLILEYGFGILNLHNICLKVFQFNKKAAKLYIKLGFKEMGVLREFRLANGKYYDFLMMDMLSKEYYERKYTPEAKHE